VQLHAHSNSFFIFSSLCLTEKCPPIPDTGPRSDPIQGYPRHRSPEGVAYFFPPGYYPAISLILPLSEKKSESCCAPVRQPVSINK
jgi:hypothetical protein